MKRMMDFSFIKTLVLVLFVFMPDNSYSANSSSSSARSELVFSAISEEKSDVSVDFSGPGGMTNPEVNLKSGKVGFSIPVASISGKSPAFSLSANYISNTLAYSQLWNDEVQSSEVGFGWTMKNLVHASFRRMTMETGSTTDDRFTFSGKELEVVDTSTDNGVVATVFKPKNSFDLSRYTFYQPEGEPSYWVVLGTNGMKYIYGGDQAVPVDTANANASLQQLCGVLKHKDNPAIANCYSGSIEYGVKWGPWIGVAYSYNYKGHDQEQLALAWNLKSMENKWGSKTVLDYIQQVQNVGGDPGAKWFTKQAYLYRVDSADRQSIQLWYCARSGTTTPETNNWGGCDTISGPRYADFIDPWIKNPEPDSYQERYSSVYVSGIGTFINGDDDKTLHTLTELSYRYDAPGGDASMAKLMLTKIDNYMISVNDLGTVSKQKSSPGHIFSYYGEKDGLIVTRSGANSTTGIDNQKLHDDKIGAVYGMIKSYTSPLGKTTTYQYVQNTLKGIQQRLLVTDLGINRRAWYGADSIVLYSEKKGKGYIDIYEWHPTGWRKVTSYQKELSVEFDYTYKEQLSITDKGIVFLGRDLGLYTISRGLENASSSSNNWGPLEKIATNARKFSVASKNLVVFTQSGSNQYVATVYYWDKNRSWEPVWNNPYDGSIAPYFSLKAALTTDYIAIAQISSKIQVTSKPQAMMQCSKKLWPSLPDPAIFKIIQVDREGKVKKVFDDLKVDPGHYGYLARYIDGAPHYMSSQERPNYIDLPNLQLFSYKERFYFQFGVTTFGASPPPDPGPGPGPPPSPIPMNPDSFEPTGTLFDECGRITSDLGDITYPDPDADPDPDAGYQGYRIMELIPSVNGLSIPKSKLIDMPSMMGKNIFDGYDCRADVFSPDGFLGVYWWAASSVTDWGINHMASIICKDNGGTRAAGVCLLGGQPIIGASDLIMHVKQCAAGSVSSLSSPSSGLSVLTNGVQQGLYYRYNPKTTRWENLGNTPAASFVNEKLEDPAAAARGGLQITGEIFGIIMTAIGIMMLPFTGGASLVLAVIPLAISIGLEIADASLTKPTYSSSISPASFSLGERYINDADTVWYINHDGSIQPLGSDSGNTASVLTGFDPSYQLSSKHSNTSANYTPFSASKSASEWGVYVRLFRNGKLGKYVPALLSKDISRQQTTLQTVSDEQDTNPANVGAVFLSYNENSGQKLYTSQGDVYLYRFIHDNASGSPVDYAISSVTVDDGAYKYQTDYDYNLDTVAYNSMAIYADVSVYPGGKTKNNGFIKNYYYTGKETDAKVWFKSDTVKNPVEVSVDSVFGTIIGVKYKTEVYQHGETSPISSKQTTYLVDYTDQKLSIRPYSTSSVIDGVTTEMNYSYHPDSRQLIQKIQKSTTYNFDDSVNVKGRVGDQEKQDIVEYSYAWEGNNTVKESNYYGLVESVKSYTLINGKTLVFPGQYSFSIYKNWSSDPSTNRYAAKCSYHSTADSKSVDPVENGCPLPSSVKLPSGLQWKRGGVVLSRNPEGGIIQSKNAQTNAYKTTRYVGYNNNYYALSSFTNEADVADIAGKTSGLNMYFGAESYENSQQIGLVLSNVGKDTKDAFAGKVSLLFEKAGSISYHYTVTDDPTANIISFWLKVENDKVSCQFISDQMQTITPSTANKWQYFYYLSHTDTTSFNLSCPEGSRIDEIAIHPVNGTFSANSYDFNNLLITDTLSTGGHNSHRVYDNFLRSRYSYSHSNGDDGGILLNNDSMTGFSRWGGYGFLSDDASETFNTEQPNVTSSIVLLEYEDSQYINYVVDIPGIIKNIGNSFYVKLFLDDLLQPKGNHLSIGDDAIRLSFVSGVMLVTSSSGVSESYKIATPYMDNIVLVYTDNTLSLWLANKLLGSFDDIKLDSSDSIQTNITHNGMVFAKNPRVGVSYRDAMGRVTQTHLLSEVDSKINDVMHANVYDGWGNMVISTKPSAPNSVRSSECVNYHADLAFLGYCADLIADLDWSKLTTQGIGGAVKKYWNRQTEFLPFDDGTDASFAFMSKLYTPSPLDRIESSANNYGKIFASDNKLGVNDYSYNDADARGYMNSIFVHADKSGLIPSKHTYSFNDDSIIKLLTIRDVNKTLNFVKRSSDAGDVLSAANKLFNLAGNSEVEVESKIYAPRSFIPTKETPTPFGINDSFVNKSKSYHTGRVIAVQETDSLGDRVTFEDSLGRLRFICNNYTPMGDADGCKYIKYDYKGRNIESGVLKNQAGDMDYYLSKADDPAYPDKPESCPIYYRFYDYAFDIDKAYDSIKDTFKPVALSNKNLTGELFAIAKVNSHVPERPVTDCGAVGKNVVVNYSWNKGNQWDGTNVHGSAIETDKAAFKFRNTYYEKQLNVSKIAYPDRDTSQFEIDDKQKRVLRLYDALGKLQTVCEGNAKNLDCNDKKIYANNHHYYLNGLLKSYSINNGTMQQIFSYDTLFRLKTIATVKTVDKNYIFKEDLEYETKDTTPSGVGYQGGNIVAATYSGSGLKIDKDLRHRYEYTYDGFNRLIEAKRFDLNQQPLESFSYQYDVNGNMLKRSVMLPEKADVYQYSYVENTNRLAEIVNINSKNEQAKYSYQDSDNTIGAVSIINKTSPDSSKKNITFTRKSSGRILETVVSDGKTSTYIKYSYDALGRRIGSMSTTGE